MTRLTALLGALLLLATACSATGSSAEDVTVAGTATPAEEIPEEPGAADGVEHGRLDPNRGTGLTAVATVFPLAWMVAEIAPAAEHQFLAARGQDPHDLELTPGDRALLETADVAVYLGALRFQPQVEAAVSSREGITVSVAGVVGEEALLTFAGAHEHDDDRAHDDDHGNDDDHAHDDDDHGHIDGADPVDPHVWFDPVLMADVALALGEAFAEADPEGAQAFRAAATALHDDLVELGAELDQMLSGCTHQLAIVSHEAYAYLLGPRGLEQEGISGAGGHGEASPMRLAALLRFISNEGISAVLAEPVEGRADAETLAREAGVDLLEIDPLEIADEDAFEAGYPALLRQQAERFAHALDCSGEG